AAPAEEERPTAAGSSGDLDNAAPRETFSQDGFGRVKRRCRPKAADNCDVTARSQHSCDLVEEGWHTHLHDEVESRILARQRSGVRHRELEPLGKLRRRLR